MKRIEYAPRHTIWGFKAYFSQNRVLFKDIFEREYEDSAASDAFEEAIEAVNRLPQTVAILREEERPWKTW